MQKHKCLEKKSNNLPFETDLTSARTNELLCNVLERLTRHVEANLKVGNGVQKCFENVFQSLQSLNERKSSLPLAVIRRSTFGSFWRRRRPLSRKPIKKQK